MSLLRDRYKTFQQELSGPEDVLEPPSPRATKKVSYMTRDPNKEIIPPSPPSGFTSLDEMERSNEAKLKLQKFQKENPQSARGKSELSYGDPSKERGIEIVPQKPPEYLERDFSDKQGFLDHYIEQTWRDRGDPFLWKPAEIAETEGISFDEAVKQQKYAIRELTHIEERFDTEKASKEKIDSKILAEKNREGKKLAAAQKERMQVRTDMITAGALIKQESDEAYKKAGFADKNGVIEYIGLLNERLVELGFPGDVKAWEEPATDAPGERGRLGRTWDAFWGEGDSAGALKSEVKPTPDETTTSEPKGIPPASEHKDKIVKDTTTNKRYKSDGTNWIEIK